MDNRTEVRDFLTSRRARITPEQAGLPSYGAARRVKGLRREEVATLAGVSVDYYNRMERGNLHGVSESVLDAVAAALQLDDAERAHLLDLAKAAEHSSRPRRGSSRGQLRPSVRYLLDAMAGVPAYVRNARTDILALNRLGAALLPQLANDGGAPVNLTRALFLDPSTQECFVEWETVARQSVAALRIEAGRSPYDRALTDLVGELSTRSEPFRTWWATHNVRLHNTATKTIRHPLVGEIEVTGEALVLPADPGLTLIAYSVEPNSAAAERLQLLASWSLAASTATADRQQEVRE